MRANARGLWRRCHGAWRWLAAPPPDGSIAARARGIDRWLGWVLLFATLLLAAGWFAPIMTVRQWMLFDESVSLLQGVGALWDHSEYVLLGMVVIFSFIFPVIKIFLTLRLWRSPNIVAAGFEKRMRRLETLGKWSMLDVFVIALFVAALNISLIMDVFVHWGIYLLASGVLVSMVVFTRLTRLAVRMRAEEEEAAQGIEARTALPPF